jgi:hypothetical protein
MCQQQEVLDDYRHEVGSRVKVFFYFFLFNSFYYYERPNTRQ